MSWPSAFGASRRKGKLAQQARRFIREGRLDPHALAAAHAMSGREDVRVGLGFVWSACGKFNDVSLLVIPCREALAAMKGETLESAKARFARLRKVHERHRRSTLIRAAITEPLFGREVWACKHCLATPGSAGFTQLHYHHFRRRGGQKAPLHRG